MDFSHVTRRAKAEALVKRGELVKIWLFPKRFGGPEDKHNLGYVPPGTQVALDSAQDRISGLIGLGSVDRMTVEPIYRGTSLVPTAIVYLCKGKGKGKGKSKGTIDITVNIW